MQIRSLGESASKSCVLTLSIVQNVSLSISSILYISILNCFRNSMSACSIMLSNQECSDSIKGVGLLGFEPRSSAPKAPRITKLPYNPMVVLLGFEPRFPDFLTSPSLSAEVTSQRNRCHGDTDLSPSHLRPSYTASDTMRQSLESLDR